MTKKYIRVTLMKSLIATRKDHRMTVRGLGLRKVRSEVMVEDTPDFRGMIRKVSYLLKWEDL